jgi:hypothetical protein
VYVAVSLTLTQVRAHIAWVTPVVLVLIAYQNNFHQYIEDADPRVAQHLGVAARVG